MKQFWPKWTLLNVLVAMLCIVVVGVILAPMSTGHGHSPIAACISNLKQFSTSQIIYAADNDERLMPYYTFNGEQQALMDSLKPYIKKNGISLCPESQQGKSNSETADTTTTYEHFPLVLRNADSNGSINLDAIAEPVAAPWMHDEILKAEKTTEGQRIETNHKGRPNFLINSFLDGHVKILPTVKGKSSPRITTDGLLVK